MAITLPGPVADFLGFIGITWPAVNEDKVREFGQHVSQFAQGLEQTHTEATNTLSQLGQSYQGAGYEQLLTTWGQMSQSHMSELITACHYVSTAMDVSADVIIGMKLEAIGELAILVVQFIAAQAAAAATFGIAEAGVLLIQQEGRQLVKFLENEIVNYVSGEVLSAAVGPLIDKVASAVSGLVYQGVADALGVPAGGGGAGDSVQIDPAAVTAHAQQMEQHAVTVANHAQAFTSVAAGVDFE